MAQKAICTLDNAWSGIPPGQERFLARLELANALISYGELARAEKLLEAAPALLDEVEAEGSDVGLRDRTAVMRARLAIASGRDAEAGPMLEDVAKRQVAADRSDAVALETLIECGLWHCANAGFAQARRCLNRARIVRGRVPRIPPHLQVALALLEAYCVEDVADEFESSHRYFGEVLELSRANASVRGTVEATVGLMGYYASIGCGETMYRFAKNALAIARSTEGHAHVRFATAWIATTFMKTEHWRAANPLIFETEPFFRPGTLHWTFLKEAQADYFARCRKYDASQASFAAASDAATKLANPKWQAIVLRDRALALKDIGRYDESVASMRRAVELADKAAGAWSRSLTHAAAAKVLKGELTSPANPPTKPARNTVERFAPLSLH